MDYAMCPMRPTAMIVRSKYYIPADKQTPLRIPALWAPEAYSPIRTYTCFVPATQDWCVWAWQTVA